MCVETFYTQRELKLKIILQEISNLALKNIEVAYVSHLSPESCVFLDASEV